MGRGARHGCGTGGRRDKVDGESAAPTMSATTAAKALRSSEYGGWIARRHHLIRLLDEPGDLDPIPGTWPRSPPSPQAGLGSWASLH